MITGINCSISSVNSNFLSVFLSYAGGISAVVEMDNTVDARKAFIALAYSRFRSQPLYLEWAPIDIFKKGIV